MGHLQMISDDLSIKHVDVPLLFEIAWVTQLQFNSLCYYDKGLEQYHVDLSDAWTQKLQSTWFDDSLHPFGAWWITR